MIGKKVPNPRKSASKVERVEGLGEYIEEAQDELDEKCVYYNGRGFISQTPEGHRAEMLALSQEATRSKDPINHYVLSWQQGERPTEAQVEQAVDILLREMGLVDHQALYGLHVDTDNVHLHVAVNRVHPVTERPVRINNGFDKEALHRTQCTNGPPGRKARAICASLSGGIGREVGTLPYRGGEVAASPGAMNRILNIEKIAERHMGTSA